jgi:TPR repeat protein
VIQQLISCLLGRTLLATLAICMACILAAPLAFAVATQNKDGVAVIIGNKDYAGSVPDVDFAHNDAEAMKRFVIDVLGFREGNVLDLRDATQAQMASAFGNESSHEAKLWSWVKEGKSDVVVFYSGHGVPGLENKRGYLLPVDADPDTPEFNGYPVDLLYANLAKLKARSVTVYLDACFSGESPKGRLTQAASNIGLSHVPEKVGAGITVVTAARGDQLASWDEEAKHGLFTRYLLEGLYGAADSTNYGNVDGEVALAEVQAYLDDKMTYAARRTYLRRQQVTVRGDEDFVLASVPEEDPAKTVVQKGSEPGAKAYQLGDYAAALRVWQPLAEQGDPSAQYNLGNMFNEGHGVEQDHAEALKWFRKASEQGFADAQHSLGNMYRNGRGVTQDVVEAAEWFGMAAIQGHVEAQFTLGRLYSFSNEMREGIENDSGKPITNFMPEDYSEAAKWYRMAAEQGHAKSSAELGGLYSLGLGVPEDRVEGLKWLRMAAELGDPFSQALLGMTYAIGRDLPQDHVLAYMWLNIAIGQGEADFVEFRDEVAGKMTAEQLFEAQRLTREWKPK